MVKQNHRFPSFVRLFLSSLGVDFYRNDFLPNCSLSPSAATAEAIPLMTVLNLVKREREGGRHCHCQPDIEGGKSVLKLESKKYGWPWNEMKACDQQNNLHSWYIFNTCQSKPLLSLFQGCRLCHQLEERMRRLCLIRYKAVSSMKRSLSSPEQRFGLWQSNILLLHYKTKNYYRTLTHYKRSHLFGFSFFLHDTLARMVSTARVCFEDFLPIPRTMGTKFFWSRFLTTLVIQVFY